MPDNKEISQLTTAEQTSNSDLIETSIPNGMTTTGYISRKQSVSMLETQMLGNTQYDTELSVFTQGNRSIFKALIEARNQGGGGGGTANLTELTQAEYDALEQAGELEEDMMYFITDANGDGSQFQPVIYSTSEREIGVWTDGKPLYEKTFTGLSISAGTSWVDTGISLSANSIDKLISCDARDSRQSFPASIGTINNDANIGIYLFVNNRTITNLTIRYTKTTDTAGSGTWTPQGVPSQHYSTTEQVVGTWIDGTTVYEKTISLDNISGTSYSTSALGLNISKIVSFFAYIQLGSEGGNAWMTSPHMENSQYRLDCHYQSADDKIYIKSDWGLSNAIVIIRYTKTSS